MLQWVSMKIRYDGLILFYEGDSEIMSKMSKQHHHHAALDHVELKRTDLKILTTLTEIFHSI